MHAFASSHKGMLAPITKMQSTVSKSPRTALSRRSSLRPRSPPRPPMPTDLSRPLGRIAPEISTNLLVDADQQQAPGESRNKHPGLLSPQQLGNYLELRLGASRTVGRGENISDLRDKIRITDADPQDSQPVRSCGRDEAVNSTLGWSGCPSNPHEMCGAYQKISAGEFLSRACMPCCWPCADFSILQSEHVY